MKNFNLFALIIGSLLLTSTSCQKEMKDVPNPKGAARDGITLEEVTVTAYRPTNYSDYSNIFSSIATLYIGNDYTARVSLYSSLTAEYAGEDINTIPGLLDKILTKLNQIRQNEGRPAFNDQEMALLRTLTIVQVIKIFLVLEGAEDFAKHCLTTEFTTEQGDGGYANAFKHMFLSFNLAKSLGDLDLAQRFTNAHEQGSASIMNSSSEMDFKNNNYAYALYRSGYEYISFDILMQLGKNGYLWTMKDGVVGQYPYVPPTRNHGPQN